MNYFQKNKNLIVLAGAASMLSACATQSVPQGTYNKLQAADYDHY